MRDRERPAPSENQFIRRIENQLAYCNEEKYPCYQRSFHTSVVALHVCA